ncbi:MAG: hypothetical protein HDR74_09865 [Bacteroides sp.]|nr:hypothetical protein [Bacteroides sp.]
MKANSTQESWWWLFFAVCIIGLAIVTVLLIDIKELPITIIGALLGVAMTVLATYFLFKGQSKLQRDLVNEQSKQQLYMVNEELKQEKEVEIFKARLKAYQDFLDSLSAYLQTKQETDKSKLKFHTAALAMHGDKKSLTKVNNTVKTIIDECNGENSDDRKLIPALFNLSEIFRQDLYPEVETESADDKNFTDSITEFAESSRYADGYTDQSAIEAEDVEQALNIDSDSTSVITSWDSYVESLKDWKVSSQKGEIKLQKIDSSILIEFKLKSGYYVVASNDGDDREYPIKLKNQFKSSYRSGANWWRPLNTLRNYRVKAGTLSDEIGTNDGARALVINWIDKIIESINKN